MMPSTVVRPSDPALRAAVRLAVLFALAKLLLQFALTLWSSHLGYGYFRDEFYYLMCGRRLAWGYVDHGPLVAVQARVGEWLFGDSVFGIRVLSALGGALAVGLTGMLAWALGGRRPSQALAMLGIMIAPVYLGTHGYLSMNSWEPVFWMVCVLALLRLQAGAPVRLWWVVFGLSAGLGLLNKASLAVFLACLGAGLLVTAGRRLLFTRWAALGVLLMLFLAHFNVMWQWRHGWPMLEFLHNGQVEHKNVVLNPLQFLGAQFAQMHPVNALLWLAGFVALLRGRSVKNARWLGFAAVLFFVLMCALHAKDYYLAPVYPVLFAAGAMAWEHRFREARGVARGRVWAFPVLETLMVVLGAMVLPMASPVLRPAAWVRYTTAMHLRAPNTETASTGPLPQFYADRFGWDQQVRIVVDGFRSLTPEEQRHVCVAADNYGEAGALDFLGHRMEPRLPAAISRHNNYWLWGPQGCDGELAISITNASPEDLQARYREVTLLGELNQQNSPWAMPFEHKRIYLLRGRRPEYPFAWGNEHHYI